ncbi:hypothetical protein ACQPUY_17515 [Clostridium nigeriense]|uniref:hypothetical protein n=1 Tax=Clostridium nigeriense TaxID=1805470 RepID=UPI003D34566A
MSKFKVGDKVRVREDLIAGEMYGHQTFVKYMEKHKGRILKINFEDDRGYDLEGADYYWTDEMLEEVKEDKMEKTFREVIADIKEGEVWESSVYRITRNEKGISIIRKDGFVPDGQMFFRDTNVYKLQRKEYTFEEAFKEYEEGKEIESESYKYKKCNGADCFKLITSIKDEWIECEDGFEIHLDEIRGKWYIND